MIRNNRLTSMDKVLKENIDNTRDNLSALSIEEELYKKVLEEGKAHLFVNDKYFDAKDEAKSKEDVVREWLDEIKMQKERYQFELEFYKQKKEARKAKEFKRELNRYPRTISEDELQELKEENK